MSRTLRSRPRETASSIERRKGASDGCSMVTPPGPAAALGALKVKPEPAGCPSFSSCCESSNALGAEGRFCFSCCVEEPCVFCAKTGAAQRSATKGSVTRTLWTRPERELGRNSFTVSIRVSRTTRRCEKLPGRFPRFCGEQVLQLWFDYFPEFNCCSASS